MIYHMMILKGALIKGLMEGRVSNIVINSEVKDGLIKITRPRCFKLTADVKSLSQTIEFIGCIHSQGSSTMLVSSLTQHAYPCGGPKSPGPLLIRHPGCGKMEELIDLTRDYSK